MAMVSSEEYVRTARQVVFKIQRAVNRCLVEGLDEPYHEDEAIQRLCDAAESAGANPNRIRKRHTVMSAWSGRHSLGGIYPTLEVAEGDWPNVMDEAEGDVGLPEKVAQLAQKEAMGQSEMSKYFVTISRRTCLRRLHLSGCFVKPDRCCEVLYLDQVNSDDFDTVWKGGRGSVLVHSLLFIHRFGKRCERSADVIGSVRTLGKTTFIFLHCSVVGRVLWFCFLIWSFVRLLRFQGRFHFLLHVVPDW